jgi:hypothetical protein
VQVIDINKAKTNLIVAERLSDSGSNLKLLDPIIFLSTISLLRFNQ